MKSKLISLLGSLAVTRAFGDFEMKPCVIADPFVDHTVLTADDTHIIVVTNFTEFSPKFH